MILCSTNKQTKTKDEPTEEERAQLLLVHESAVDALGRTFPLQPDEAQRENRFRSIPTVPSSKFHVVF